MLIYPTVGPLELNLTTAAAPKETQADGDSAGQVEAAEFTLEQYTGQTKVMQPETPAPLPPRGDDPVNKPQVR